MARCEAWVGLAPPDETADCELDLGHDGVHEGTLNGSVRDRTGAYRYVPVVVRWANGEQDANVTGGFY